MNKFSDTFRRKLTEGWGIFPAAELSAGGEEISRSSFDASAWTPAVVPGTVLGALVQAGVYQDLYVGMNMEQVPKGQFRKPWWYRTEFVLSEEQASSVVLIGFEGINYKADIWVNGKKVAEKETVTGAFRRFRFDITDMIQAGTNVLALEVTPPGPGDFSTGFVDWNIDPPDNNMGLFREVILFINKGISIENPFVDPQFNPDEPSWASLTITADLVNHGRKRVKGMMKVMIDSLEVSMPVTVAAGGRKSVTFSPHEYLELNIRNPHLWWPNNLGKPSLYRCDLSFELNGEVSYREEVAFGIRKVEDFFENGHRGFRINGHKVLIKGAGWTDDLLLMDTHASLEAQIEYVKHLNLNCIRLEGFWGKDQYLYDLCDRHGILMMAGWTCHWEHEEFLGKPADPKYGGIIEPEDIDLMVQAWEDQILWLRNHPSIFVWGVGSDKLPHPDAERRYAVVLEKYDPTRPYLNSTGGVGSDQGVITEVELISEISGSSGMKMLGPYDYTPPVYWYTDKNFGGAYGFNTETSPGANVPPLESIKKMIPPDHLWPVDEVWEYHCGKNVFRTLDRFITAVERRYGKPGDVEEFAFKAQLLNYELMRPMFEAFQVNKRKAMGVVQWMLNSAWPNMYWQLYDSYLMPNGAFYGARNACRPLHLAYNYGDHTIHVINDHFETVKELTARIRLVDLTGQVVTDERIDVSCRAESAGKIHDLQVPDNISPAYFLDLRLLDKEGREQDRNFYWLSRTEDVLDYEYEFEDWPFYTPSKQYADYKAMKEMPEAELEVEVEKGLRDHCLDFMVTLNNRSESVAFFTELALTDKKSGRSFLPVYWDDNYISLLPGETRKVKVSLREELLKDEDPVLRVKGWNVKERKLEA